MALFASPCLRDGKEEVIKRRPDHHSACKPEFDLSLLPHFIELVKFMPESVFHADCRTSLKGREYILGA